MGPHHLLKILPMGLLVVSRHEQIVGVLSRLLCASSNKVPEQQMAIIQNPFPNRIWQVNKIKF